MVIGKKNTPGFRDRTWVVKAEKAPDYIWVEIGYGLEKIVLLPRTWSVMFFAKKTPCLVASIVTLRIRVETDPGHDY